MEITIFKDIKNTSQPFYRKVELVLTRIEQGNSKDIVKKIRAEKDKEKRNELKKLLPGSSICAEESGVDGDEEFQWVIDPLDGTTNFESGIPFFCISVALTRKNRPVVGAIYAPLFNEFFFAVEGRGAFCNDSKIVLRKCELLKDAIISFGIAEYDADSRSDVVKSLCVLGEKSFALRRFGALALDFAYCACGRMDAIVSRGYKWWDVAAGIVLIQEAGGVAIGKNGQILDINDSVCVVGRRPIGVEILKLLPSFG